MNIFIVLGIVVITLIILGVLIIIGGKKSNGAAVKSPRMKDRAIIIRDANKRLAQDPHDPDGLEAMGNLYYQEHLWEKAMPIYAILIDLAVQHPRLNQAEAALRLGICALKLNNPTEAVKSLFIARKLDPINFEINFNLGKAYFLTGDFDKALPVLKQAFTANPDSVETQKYLGESLVKLRKFREALPFLKAVLELEPDNKEILFTMAECLSESGAHDRALKIFSHLRADPEFGSQACQYAGIIHLSVNQTEKAIEDFEIGLKHQNVPLDLQNDLKYRLASCYIKTQNLSGAIVYLKEIQSVTSGYKDVATLLSRYSELNQNKNLQSYLIGGNSDFVALCRKMVQVFFRGSRVKFIDIEVQLDHAEILTDIDTPKWQDIVIFRFYRSTGVIGELLIRDFHAKIREAKAGRGICLTAGTYSEESFKFTEGRPIDLLDKTKLNKILNSIDGNMRLQKI